MSSVPTPIQELLDGLNPPQREAVAHRDGPLLVLAGPGSGKTRVITRRAAALVHGGTPPHNVLAITFTNKAADEMRRRITALGVGQGMWIYTFHALGVRLLREFGELAGVRPGFSIYDEADSLRVIKEAQQIAQVSTESLRPETARKHISDAKNKLLTPDKFADQANWFQHREVADVYEAYQTLLKERNAVDFDDLLMRVALVLSSQPEVTDRLSHRFRFILIDEYQDTNHAQYLIARQLSSAHGNICATGDPDQSIYAWRGADISNILNFEKDFPNARVVRLEQNYRSTGHILTTASALISNNCNRKHKDLWADAPPGEPVRIWRFNTGDDEAGEIARTIARLRDEGRPYNDFAIAYRVNALSRGLEEALRDAGIRYRIARGVEFYNRREIRDLLAYLRILANPADEVALLRIINNPPRKIGPRTIAQLKAGADRTGRTLFETLPQAGEIVSGKAGANAVLRFAALAHKLQTLADLPVSEAVSAVLSQSGLEKALREEDESQGEDRLANAQELVTAALRYEQDQPDPTLDGFLNRVSLVSDQDAVDEDAPCVLLLTLHAAKGLEFPVVFIAGLEDGLLPHERVLHEGREIEEERRLCFVGMTRARRQLYLTHADERYVRGQRLPHSPSRFLREVGDEGIECDDRRTALTGTSFLGSRSGFEPVVDDLPAEEAARLVPKRTLRSRRPAPRPKSATSDIPLDPNKPYGDWIPGTLVEHARYGVGQVLWIRQAPGQTRAGIRFAGYGEKTLVLEFTTIRKLSR